MGMFTAKLKVWYPTRPAQVGEFELWVDTEADYSWISRERLEAIGIQPTGRIQFRTTEGGVLERDMAVVFVSAEGHIGGDTVAMAEPGDREVMGVLTLESLALAPDVIQKKLVPVKVSLALLAADSRRSRATRGGKNPLDRIRN